MGNYKDAVEEKAYPLWRLLRNPLALFKVAKELRLYEKFGLDVKGSVFLTALLAGNAHLTTDSSAGVSGAVARGAPIVTVSTNSALPYQLVALPIFKSPAEIRGKTVGSSRIGAGTDFLLRRILANLGLTPGKDVSLIPTGVSESEKRINYVPGKNRCDHRRV